MAEFTPLRLAEPSFDAGALAAIERVLVSGRLTQGPMVEAFEQAIAQYTGACHAVAVSSATTALELSLAALDIGPGDEVAVADFTYPATGNAVLERGATLRLVDVEPGSYCIDPNLLEAALTRHTKAVIAVDVFGLPADYRRIEPLLRELGIALICDAACALGGAIGDHRCGTFGRLSAFSFHPRKSLTTGEGGMVTADDEELARRMRRLRNHGSERDGWKARFVEPGFNYRLSELNAALGLAQVPAFAEVVDRRRLLARSLTEQLRNVPGVTPQAEPPGHRHPYQSYVVTLEEQIDRDSTIAALRELGVEATLGTYAMHAEPAFGERCGVAPGDLPVSHRLALQTLAVPLHQAMTMSDIERVAESLRNAIAVRNAPRARDTTSRSA
jgi:perosamine synthetase